MQNKYDVAAYIWPAYTGDEPRSKMFWPEGYGEWQSVKNAVKKFPAHDWPRKPLWGYVNEADPYVMQSQIQAATDHGVNVFIYDWYWYDGRPYLEQCLNNGFLKAKNNSLMKFYLMWANHDANNYWNINLSDSEGGTVIWKGSVKRDEFENVCRRVTQKYFSLDNYYKINGSPVFMIYEMSTLIQGLGGIPETVDALNWFRDYVKSCGFPNLHLQFTARGENFKNLSGVDSSDNITTESLMKTLGADSCSHYQFVHFTDIDRDYNEIMDDVLKEWKRIEKSYSIPYFPHISCGWDNNPRFKNFRKGIVKNNTPENFKKALIHAKNYLDAHPDLPPLVTINSWNEWTETSYLQPDDLYGYGYLQAVREVFGK